MRSRLWLVVAVFTLLAVAGPALLLLDRAAAERTQRFIAERAADLDRFAELATRADDPSDDQDALAQAVRTHARLYGEGVLVVDGAGRPVLVVGMVVGAAEVNAAVRDALRGQPSWPDRIGPWSDALVLVGRPVGDGIGGAVVMRADPGAAAADVAGAWTAIAAGASAAVLLLAGLGLLLARWVLRPDTRLAAGVRAIAARSTDVPTTGPAELRAVAEMVDRLTDAATTALEQQRRLVADTADRLRPPLDALRHRVDALDQHVAEPGRVLHTATAGEVDRLRALLDGLLALADAEHRAILISATGAGPAADPVRAEVGEVLAERLDRLGPAADAAAVRIVVEPGPPVAVGCAVDELGGILDAVLDNAVRHTGVGTTVRVGWWVHGEPVPDNRYTTDISGQLIYQSYTQVRLEVSDDGPGLPEPELALATQRFWRSPGARPREGNGLGLTIAARLVTARGGTLRLAAAPEHGLVVTVDLPCA